MAARFSRDCMPGCRGYAQICVTTTSPHFLIVTTIVQRLDGYRALTRLSSESCLQLSLKSMLLLMQVGGMACAWVGPYLFIDQSHYRAHPTEVHLEEPPTDVSLLPAGRVRRAEEVIDICRYGVA